jgi:hypothetical protein
MGRTSFAPCTAKTEIAWCKLGSIGKLQARIHKAHLDESKQRSWQRTILPNSAELGYTPPSLQNDQLMQWETAQTAWQEIDTDWSSDIILKTSIKKKTLNLPSPPSAMFPSPTWWLPKLRQFVKFSVDTDCCVSTTSSLWRRFSYGVRNCTLGEGMNRVSGGGDGTSPPSSALESARTEEGERESGGGGTRCRIASVTSAAFLAISCTNTSSKDDIVLTRWERLLRATEWPVTTVTGTHIKCNDRNENKSIYTTLSPIQTTQVATKGMKYSLCTKK